MVPKRALANARLGVNFVTDMTPELHMVWTHPRGWQRKIPRHPLPPSCTDYLMQGSRIYREGTAGFVWYMSQLFKLSLQLVHYLNNFISTTDYFDLILCEFSGIRDYLYSLKRDYFSTASTMIAPLVN